MQSYVDFTFFCSVNNISEQSGERIENLPEKTLSVVWFMYG